LSSAVAAHLGEQQWLGSALAV